MTNFIDLESLKSKEFPCWNETHLTLLKNINTFKTAERSKRIVFILLCLGQILRCSKEQKEYYFMSKEADNSITFELDFFQIRELFSSIDKKGQKLFGSDNIKKEELNRSLKEIRQVLTKKIVLCDDVSEVKVFDEFKITTDGIKGKFNNDFMYLLNCSNNNKNSEFYDSRVGEYMKDSDFNIAMILDFKIRELIIFTISYIRYNYRRNETHYSILKKLDKYIFYNCNYTDSKKISKIKEYEKKVQALISDYFTFKLDIVTKKDGRKTVLKEVLPVILEKKKFKNRMRKEDLNKKDKAKCDNVDKEKFDKLNDDTPLADDEIEEF